MPEPPVRIEIPVLEWDPAEFTTSSVKTAVGLAAQLGDPQLTLKWLDVRASAELPIRFAMSGASSELHRSVRRNQLSITARVNLQLVDEDDEPLATLKASAVARHGPLEPGFDDWAALEAFVFCIGVSDPLEVAMRAIESGLRSIGDRVDVVASQQAEVNLLELTRLAEQPDMDSAEATPMNPFALAGIPGDEAAQWDRHGFSASDAEQWIAAGFGPEEAHRLQVDGLGPEVDSATLGAR